MTRLESWQALAKKMAHEVKNSLTPIRLTMEEISVRQAGSGGDFYEQAAQIVVDEVQSLERRVRAFSEFSAEPPVSPKTIDINSLLEERIAFLRTAHPGIIYSTRLAPEHPCVYADEDLVKGVLTNLLENAAQAVTPGGVVLGVTMGVTAAANDKITIEVHDSGPGLSPQARSSLFQPAISFKRGGMGLGLSIARKSALLAGGDIQLVPGELGGAAFRVLLLAGDELQALWRMTICAKAIVPTPLRASRTRSHECERGTHECVRHMHMVLFLSCAVLGAQEPTLRPQGR